MGIGKGPVRFGAFEFDFAAACLRRDGVRVQLSSQPAQVLAALLDRSGEVVTREELRFRLWGDSQFSDFEHSLNVAVAKVREALGDSAGEPQFVATVPRRGYRFVATVTPSEATGPGRVPHRSWAAMVAGIAAVALAASTAGDRKLRTFEDGYTGRIRLAVLSFENLSGNPQLEYICNGLTEELISRLGRLQPERLAVIARTPAMRYKTIGPPVREIGRELEVDYVLRGSLLGDRISAELTRVKDGSHMWADVYTSDPRGQLALQREIERSVARQARLTLVSSGARDRPPDPRAHDEYLLGRYQWNKRNLEGYHKAIGHFEHAIAIDRAYARAYAGLADTYLLLNESKAGTEAREALKFDPLLAEAHASLGLFAMNQDWDWAGSQREFQRALQFNSNYATAHHWYAEFLTAQGRFDEALTEIDRARELDPLSRIIATASGKFLYYARRYPQAIDRLRNVLAEDPGFDEAHFYLAEAYLSAGHFEEALAELDAVHDPSRTDLLDVKAAVLARMGRRAEAEDVVSGLVAYRLSTYGLIALGQREAALADVEAAIRVRSTFVTSMRVHPLLDPLRGDPRFQAMLHRVSLDRVAR